MSFFGQNIRFLRNKAQLSQTAFAEIFNLKRAAVGAYEEERAEPKVEVFVMIARHFGIPVEDLICSNLQLQSSSTGSAGDISGIPYISADEHKTLATGYIPAAHGSRRIQLPNIPDPEGLIAVEYGDSTLIVSEIDSIAAVSCTDRRSLLAAGANGLQILAGTGNPGNCRIYNILYIIKRYDTGDFADAILGNISQRIERLEGR